MKPISNWRYSPAMQSANLLAWIVNRRYVVGDCETFYNRLFLSCYRRLYDYATIMQEYGHSK
jgi:hypothetical protein